MTMRKRFVKGMVIYAVVFLVLAAVGLAAFWDFIDAYERSRPINSVKAYVERLTAEDMIEGSQLLLDQLDENIRSREESGQIIRDSVTQPLSYAKKSSESTSNRQVYVLRSGSQVIGQFAIAAGDQDHYGFRAWTVTDESFDFSHLLAKPISVTVPSDFTVSINGNPLDSSYITEKDIPFAALEAFYDDFTLPTMVTYTADSFLGSLTLEVTDRDGNPVEITEETDMDALLPDCAGEELSALDAFVGEFLKRYVSFTGSANGEASGNYARLLKYLVADSALAQRLRTAIDGLNYAQSNGDTIREISVNQCVDLEEDRYYCDLTYVVETLGRKGAVSTTNNLKLIILDTEDGLRVEAMTRY